MSVDVPGIRPRVISRELQAMLDPYRGFRHVFRNAYGRRLDWQRMKPLIDDLPAVLTGLTEELTRFLETMQTTV